MAFSSRDSAPLSPHIAPRLNEVSGGGFDGVFFGLGDFFREEGGEIFLALINGRLPEEDCCEIYGRLGGA
jgi:hypothetical protein